LAYAKREVVKIILGENPSDALKYVHGNLKADKEIVEISYKKDQRSLRYAHKDIIKQYVDDD